MYYFTKPYMKECALEFMQKILDHLCIAPETQVDPELVKECQKFKESTYTKVELFDFIVNISKLDYARLSDTAVIGDVSTFVIELCALDKYYKRPTI